LSRIGDARRDKRLADSVDTLVCRAGIEVRVVREAKQGLQVRSVVERLAALRLDVVEHLAIASAGLLIVGLLPSRIDRDVRAAGRLHFLLIVGEAAVVALRLGPEVFLLVVGHLRLIEIVLEHHLAGLAQTFGQIRVGQRLD
jgi:hypothetical protein